ncbi:NAD(P)/FAD-dependent oxidoreductase [Adhaeribacter rhizoryzae]|uniref:NAD(P)/FAD-dependent oxidoreductase n=1 Tax=Adhaeribacter rhizoryzae TaxID=2607907 RepID=UPI002938D445|nr:NAD(P)/FAD-dependent oxidoreductase [Adhaeribacter rhizoryzae]
MIENSKNISIVGGGLAGLVSAIALAKAGVPVTLFERKKYPFHKVCGEYISNEVRPYLESLGVAIDALGPAHIDNFLLSAPSGNALTSPLDLGGFGVSRYTLDNYLVQVAREAGAVIREGTTVQEQAYEKNKFRLKLASGEEHATDLVLNAYGKRSNLDRHLQRQFFRRSSPYIGVKYHVRFNQPKNLICLHNFKDGYAGISAIEANKYCFCYLTTRANLKASGTIAQMEQNILSQNPHLAKIFREAEFLYPQPEVINEISFAPKTCVENHVLFCGDAAGLITPLCGNGMAMAIHAAKIASTCVLEYLSGHLDQDQLEKKYTRLWQQEFSRRLQTGRLVQGLFGRPVLTEMVLHTFKQFPAGVRFLMKQTHGKPF